MIDEKKRRMIEDALTWHGYIGCCSDKARYAYRMLFFFHDIGLDLDSLPEDVCKALNELQQWESLPEPCETINAFLRSILAGAVPLKQKPAKGEPRTAAERPFS